MKWLFVHSYSLENKRKRKCNVYFVPSCNASCNTVLEKKDDEREGGLKIFVLTLFVYIISLIMHQELLLFVTSEKCFLNKLHTCIRMEKGQVRYCPSDYARSWLIQRIRSRSRSKTRADYEIKRAGRSGYLRMLRCDRDAPSWSRVRMRNGIRLSEDVWREGARDEKGRTRGDARNDGGNARTGENCDVA